MSFSVTRFAQDSAFERYALDELAPAIIPSHGLQIIDYLEEHRTEPRIHASAGSATVKAVAAIGGRPATVDIAPLAFGMAWKILDLVVEPLLPPRADGQPQTIGAKVNSARTGNGPQRLKPFTGEVEIWKRLMRLYGNTMDLRHSIAHREIIIHDDGSLGATPGHEPAPLRPPSVMTADELGYFLRATQGFYTALLEEQLLSRQRKNLCFLLDQLTSHHDLGPLGGVEVRRNVLVLARPQLLPSGRFAFDAQPYLAYALNRFPNAGCDIHLYFPNGVVLGGHLEDAPTNRPCEIRLDYLPGWLNPIH
ncbi:hypothetical protein [Streptosporangium saharense]|uniref:hypothetical protein n=1 Tax=Streptosporangium saharense TaxID=1706840 RepID=UPI0034180853